MNERRKGEEGRPTREESSHILDGIGCGVAVLTVTPKGDFSILYANNALFDMVKVGRPADGQTPLSAFSYYAQMFAIENPKENDRIKALCRAVYNKDCAHLDNFRIPRHNGSFLWADIDASRNRDEDDYKVFYVTFRDVTERVSLQQRLVSQLEHEQVLREEAINANESKSVFLSSISHDMRTPLNGIIGFTNLALQTGDIASMRDYLRKIKKSSSLLLDLVNDTLMLSKIENGKAVVEHELLDNFDLLGHITVPIQAAAAEKGIDFIVDSGKLHHCLVRTDRLNVEKIFLNLLSNAVHFTPSGGTVTFTAESLSPAEDGYNFCAAVRDTGIGMEDDFLAKMYEPFTQESVAVGLGGNDTGTGLGLFIVRQLVNVMGGDIEAASKPGVGTYFTVRMHIECATEGALAPEEPEAAAEQALAGMKVLLCEDNFLNTEITRTLLEQRRAEVVCAENGLMGVKDFADSSIGEYDAVLMDIRMPEMDGFQATEAIRSLARDDAQRVPILALTADDYPEDIKKCLTVGMDAHIAKPVNPNLLMRELLRYRQR